MAAKGRALHAARGTRVRLVALQPLGTPVAPLADAAAAELQDEQDGRLHGAAKTVPNSARPGAPRSGPPTAPRWLRDYSAMASRNQNPNTARLDAREHTCRSVTHDVNAWRVRALRAFGA